MRAIVPNHFVFGMDWREIVLFAIYLFGFICEAIYSVFIIDHLHLFSFISSLPEHECGDSKLVAHEHRLYLWCA